MCLWGLVLALWFSQVQGSAICLTESVVSSPKRALRRSLSFHCPAEFFPSVSSVCSCSIPWLEEKVTSTAFSVLPKRPWRRRTRPGSHFGGYEYTPKHYGCLTGQISTPPSKSLAKAQIPNRQPQYRSIFARALRIECSKTPVNIGPLRVYGSNTLCIPPLQVRMRSPVHQSVSREGGTASQTSPPAPAPQPNRPASLIVLKPKNLTQPDAT